VRNADLYVLALHPRELIGFGPKLVRNFECSNLRRNLLPRSAVAQVTPLRWSSSSVSNNFDGYLAGRLRGVGSRPSSQCANLVLVRAEPILFRLGPAFIAGAKPIPTAQAGKLLLVKMRNTYSHDYASWFAAWRAARLPAQAGALRFQHQLAAATTAVLNLPRSNSSTSAGSRSGAKNATSSARLLIALSSAMTASIVMAARPLR
jgi:hypothetical protein